MTNDNGHPPQLSKAQLDALDIVKDISPTLADAVRKTFDTALRPDQAAAVEARKTRWTVGELAATEFPQPKSIVAGVIVAGLTFLAARPKFGKSWLALQIAHGVGTGGRVLNIPVEAGNVLYIALEDGPRRLQDRIKKQNIPAGAKITFETEWKLLTDGGLLELQTEVMLHDYRIVIIDTLSRALGGRADQMDQGVMSEVIGGLQKLALSRNIAILLIDHHTKPKGNGLETDPIDDILGATAKAAVADAAIGLYRKRGQRDATMKVTGRDLAEREINLTWDGELCCWQYAGEADQVRENTERGRVFAAVKALFDEGQLPTVTRVSKSTGIDIANVSDCLSELANRGKVKIGDKVGKEQPYYPIEGAK